MRNFPDGFLWGAATAAHQIEGNNLNSDFWASEGNPGMERSGDACDSYHRYPEDMQLLADAGYTSYRFSVEWSRIEPLPGLVSHAELAHYRRMIDKALELGLTPVVTLHHFTNPKWFADEGGWLAPTALDRFRFYVETVTTILDDVEWVITMNEPNMLAMITGLAKKFATGGDGEWQSPTVEDGPRPPLPAPEVEIGERFVEAHHLARAIVREKTSAKVGWSVANRAYVARPGGEQKMKELQWQWEDLYLEASRGDDFVGVQSYTSQWVTSDGIEPFEDLPDNTLVGTAYRPDAVAIAVRHVHELLDGIPIMITENGIATSDDEQRIAYTSAALQHLADTIEEGVDLRGYQHWSLLDNFEWGHWAPTFGLIHVDRVTFERQPKPSFAWLGNVARANAIQPTA